MYPRLTTGFGPRRIFVGPASGGARTLLANLSHLTVSLDFLPARTASPEETLALGEHLAAVLETGDVVALFGDLGAGKTHLVKGLARGLGVAPAVVSSPTFTLVNEYDGALPLYHLDLYRLERPEEAERIGLDDYLYGDGLCVIEWPERIEALLPAHTLRLRLTHLGGDGRQIEVIAP